MTQTPKTEMRRREFIVIPVHRPMYRRQNESIVKEHLTWALMVETDKGVQGREVISSEKICM